MLTTKVDKLDVEVRQCVGSSQDIKVTLIAMDAKYENILLLLPSKAAKQGSSNNNDTDHNGMLQHRIAILDFPKFSGGEPTSWTYRANQFLQIKRLQKINKVLLASFHLDGEECNGFRWYEKT